jgi:medium-chain acyl-[acyl-carrier-protein] hydrolase
MLHKTFDFSTDLLPLQHFRSLFAAIEHTAVIDGTNAVAGYDDMKHSGLYWILADIKIHFVQSFAQQSLAHIETFPVEVNNVYAIRAHNICDTSGNLMIEVSTRWAVISVQTRSLAKLPEWLTTKHYEKGARHMPYHKPRIKSLNDYSHVSEFPVSKEDIDKNDHVNNIVYIQYIIAALSEHQIDVYSIQSLTVQFKGETYFGDMLLVYSIYEWDAQRLNVKVLSKSSQTELCLAEIVLMA